MSNNQEGNEDLKKLLEKSTFKLTNKYTKVLAFIALAVWLLVVGAWYGNHSATTSSQNNLTNSFASLRNFSGGNSGGGGGAGAAGNSATWGGNAGNGGAGINWLSLGTYYGGGGGGSLANANGGAGGSGIVIIRYPDIYRDAVSVTNGSKTTYTGYKVYTFTQSGAITF